MSRKERDRMKIMAGVNSKELSQVQAAELMRLGYRQAKRVWRRYQDEGDAGLVHQLRGKPGLRCKPAALRTQVMKLCAEDRYEDFGPTLMAEELQKEGIVVDHDNHALIHKHVAANLGAEVLLDLENHHNFAWKERHVINGVEKEVIVHRKGATPAGQGVLGIIPGSMASPGFVVSGKGNPESLNSASHGAGRVMSRTQASKTFEWKKVNAFLREKGVTLISAGLDEVPMVYKNIHEVMAAQKDLVTILGQFDPKLVKMAPHGECAED